jgi:hypothetical protein
MIPCRPAAGLLASLAGCLLTIAPAQANLLRNGSFEKLSRNQPSGWHALAGDGVEFKYETTPGRTSKRSAQIRVANYDRIDRTSRASLEQRDLTGLAGDRWYRLSGWLRAEGLRSGLVRALLVDDHAGENGGLYLELVATGEWRHFEKTFHCTLKPDARPRLEFFIEETGALQFDDLELVEVPEPAPAFTDVVPPGASANLVPNASFEGSTENWSSLGRRTGWVGGLSSLFGELDATTAFQGRHSLRISLDRATLPQSHFDVWPTARVLQDAPLAANIGWIPVPRGRDVTLSAWLRADRPGVPAVLALNFSDPEKAVIRKEQRVELNTEWTRYSFTCPAEAGYAFVAVGPDLGGTTFDAAVVWLDAVQLEAASSPSAFAVRETFAVRATTARFGNVFTDGDRPRLQLAIENPGAARELNLHVRIRDYFGRELPLQVEKIAIGDHRLLLRHLEPALPGKGHYTITLHESGDPAAPNLLLRPLILAWIDGYTAADSPFGFNHTPSTAELSEQLRRAGVTWGRDWSINWQQLEPTQGALDFTPADLQIDRIRREGLNPIALLPPFPSANWASSIPDAARDEAPEWSKLWIEMAYAPSDPALLDEFIRKAAEHFKRRVSTWEFLNEPFYTLHALPALNQIDESLKGLAGAEYRVQDYIDLLARAYRVTKSVNPDSRLIGGISGRADLMSREFIEAGGLDHLDIFNLHIYPGLRRPEYYIREMERLLGFMDRAGGRKPIWLTEYGYYGVDETLWQPHVLNAWDWAGNRFLRDEREASDFSIRFAVILLAHGVEKIFYHSGMGMSSEVNSHAENESPLTRYGGVPRKLYAAQAALSRLLGAQPRFVAPTTFAPDAADLHGYVFENGRTPVAVLWSAGAPVDVTLAPGVIAHDVVGNPIAGRTLTLGPSPCYLTATGLEARQLAQSWQQR